MRSLTCKSCGWVHFGVTRKFAIEETKRFAEFYNSSSRETQENYGGRQISLIRSYATCNCCGKPNTNMRDSTAAEIQKVAGSTIGPMINPEEKVI